MILHSLINYYDRLEADPSADPELPKFGYGPASVGFAVVITETGEFVRIDPVFTEVQRSRGKVRIGPKRLIVPGNAPRTSGVHPYLLSDTAEYLLAIGKRAEKKHGECISLHETAQPMIDHTWFDAVCAFLSTWVPTQFVAPEHWDYLSKYRGCFRIDGPQRYVHAEPSIRDAIASRVAAELDWPATAVSESRSLYDGSLVMAPETHAPQIQGVRGAQSTGAAIISFNKTAFTSLGKEQSLNAPLSAADAFKYCTALNRLLADDERHTNIGDATVVWWTDGPSHDAEQLVGYSLLGMWSDDFQEALDDPDAEVDADVKRLSKAVKDIASGRSPTLDGTEQHLNVLGLSPNAARLSVRFWWRGPVSDMIDHIAQHYADARLEPVPDYERHRPLTIYRMVRETARVHGGNSDMKTISPVLSGELARAVLRGTPYPQSLLETIVRRVRTDGRVNHARVSITKACITRRRRLLGRTSEEVPVSLDLEGPTPYQLGRLFAVLEKTQSDALGDVNASIRERYFGSACATPANIFPRLCRLTQHHLGKLSTGQRIHREKLMQEIIGHISAFPRHYALEQQGLFQIGYYHQRQDLFTKRSTETTTEENDQ